jgi:hypothetical protein
LPFWIALGGAEHALRHEAATEAVIAPGAHETSPRIAELVPHEGIGREGESVAPFVEGDARGHVFAAGCGDVRWEAAGFAQEINQQGTTVLVVEQNAQQALSRAHRAYVLETGNIVKSGTGIDLLHDPAVKAAYLGVA